MPRLQKRPREFRGDRFGLPGGPLTNPAKYSEAIEALVQALVRVRGVRSVVLFGSAARGTAPEDSDIDLFLDCEDSARDRVRRIAYGISDRTGVPFNLVFYGAHERTRFDTQFLDSILRNRRPRSESFLRSRLGTSTSSPFAS